MSLYEDKEKEVLEHMKNYDEESCKLLRNHEWTEGTAVKAFLRKCEIRFKNDELITVSQVNQPPDVRFRNANFEVTEVQDEGRKRDDEYREKIKKDEQSKCPQDLKPPPDLTDFTPIPMKFLEVLEKIQKGMNIKYCKYNSPEICRGLDLLVYVNLKRHDLPPHKNKTRVSPQFLDEAKTQGWRSISFLTKSYAGVVFGQKSTPVFIKQLEGVMKSGNYNDFED
jgi:hypothetical protein